MKKSFLVAASFALLIVGAAGCGGGKSSDNGSSTTNAAASAAGNAMNSAESAAGSAASSMQNAASNTMTSAKNGAMGGAAMAMGKMPNCGAVKPVWVNMNSKAYHEPGDPYYGKTKHGEYMCPSQAKAQGYHPAGATKSSQ